MIKLTKQRQLIYDILKAKQKPLNAEMIYSLLPNNTMNLSTIYRSLEFFLDKGLVSRSFMNSSNYYYLNSDHHHHYMICLKCHKMIPIDCNLINLKELKEKHNNFNIVSHDITIYGYCSKHEVE